MTLATHVITAEAFFLMGSDHKELVKGEVVDMAPPGFDHGDCASQIASLLRDFVRPRGLGKVVVESGYILSRSEDTVRGPDVSFVSADRLKDGKGPTGFFDGPPDLAIEVLSPGDTAYEIEQKVQEYLAAGTRLVWIVHPLPRTVTIHTPGHNPIVLSRNDTLNGADVLPGFTATVADLFA